MGDLPKDRVDPFPPFYITGVDYAGYFLLKDRKERGCKLLKAYVALFVCFTARAVHLELVSDLTAHSLIAAFKRFVSRRGKPLKMHSDNGTNFQDANRKLKEFYDFIKTNKREIQGHSTIESIAWHFIPSQSTHFGGLWEAGVKSMKSHLKRVVSNAHLRYEEFSIILTQVESVLNSRPISTLSSDPNDLCPLTPVHFLIGRPFTAIPEPDLMFINENRLNHFQRLQKMVQHIWSRWSKEFIGELQQRKNWKQISKDINIGTQVLIKEKNVSPLIWQLGRIVEHPGIQVQTEFPGWCP
ncbi:uncharacterized protein [Diabrotica undecimpunctata]|uniref:uncharacterized protein n=1 Tax=Diabrotica undecimpunctata TaxID=50387 RepID=UPI003B6400A4